MPGGGPIGSAISRTSVSGLHAFEVRPLLCPDTGGLLLVHEAGRRYLWGGPLKPLVHRDRPMSDRPIATAEQQRQVWAETFQAQRELLESLFLQAEQAISRAQDAVNRSRLVQRKIAARRATLEGRLDGL
jgi:hypothetical protein